MKRTVSFALSLILLLTLLACSASPSKTPSAAATDAVQQSEATAEASNVQTDRKILIVYFSANNTVDADAVSGATPIVGGEGATVYLANLIQNEVGGDLAPITPLKDYPLEYNAAADAAKLETDGDARPGYTFDADPSQYDIIFVGYPMWWYTLPMVLYTFFDDYDLSGKTIIPFTTHAGSRDGGTWKTIAGFEPDATVLDGLAVAGNRVGSNTAKDVKAWLEKLGF